YTLGIYEPSTFVIELSEVHLDDYQEIIANIEKGLGTGAQYVGQLDYKNDGGYRTINFAIITQLQIKSDVEIYTEVNEHEYRDLFINVPFSYLGDGMFYDCHFNFKVSNDPAITVLDKETGEQITVAEHTEKFLEEMRAKFED
ncbi:MAG: hypothetical protein MJ193_03740, partial [Clostridia bacterium]|nr:hypothetical protein [Clostridia bacterium]